MGAQGGFKDLEILRKWRGGAAAASVGERTSELGRLAVIVSDCEHSINVCVSEALSLKEE